MECPTPESGDQTAKNRGPLFRGFSPERSMFWGQNGLRAGWSLLLYIAIFLAISVLVGLELYWVVGRLHPGLLSHKGELYPLPSIARESATLLAVIVATAVMARIERQRTASYGLGGANRVRHFLIGLVSGFCFLSLLIAILVATGHLQLQFSGAPMSETVRYAAAWGLCFLIVGFTEEWMVRGYPLFTLARGMRFWPGAIALAAAFGLMHWGNHGESPFGLTAAALIALVFSLSLWRLGHLWWAIGFHVSWDWAESFFYGTPDSGLVSVGRLMHAHPVGPLLLSGGTTGPEGSVWVLPVIALVALFVWWTQPDRRARS